jgi:uncharacterized protein (DUF2147 family)
MRNLFASAAVLAFATSPALADSTPIGEWMVKDGYGTVRIDNCAGKMWGIIAWEKVAGVDNENPDPAKRGRPSLGVPILLGMAPTRPNKWEGEIYNTENGKTYSGNISLIDDHTLQLEGCLFPNFLCGGQKWTRVTTPPAGGVSLPVTPRQPTKKGPASAAQSDVCARVAAETGANTGTGTAKK